MSWPISSNTHDPTKITLKVCSDFFFFASLWVKLVQSWIEIETVSPKSQRTNPLILQHISHIVFIAFWQKMVAEGLKNNNTNEKRTLTNRSISRVSDKLYRLYINSLWCSYWVKHKMNKLAWCFNFQVQQGLNIQTKSSRRKKNHQYKLKINKRWRNKE